MVLQRKEVSRWEAHNTPIPPVHRWIYAEMGLTFWDTYYPVLNWMYIRVMINLSIIIDIHTKSVYFVLVYTQSNVKIEILMEIPIGLGVEGAHPR